MFVFPFYPILCNELLLFRMCHQNILILPLYVISSSGHYSSSSSSGLGMHSLMLHILSYVQSQIDAYFCPVPPHFHCNHTLLACSHLWGHGCVEASSPDWPCPCNVSCFPLQTPMSKWTCTMPKRESPKRRLMWRSAPPMLCSTNCLSLIFLVRVLKRSVLNFWFWIPKGGPAMRWSGGWSWKRLRKEPVENTGRRSVTIQGDRSPSGTCSVMVSILAVRWDLTIFTRQGMIFFLSDI